MADTAPTATDADVSLNAPATGSAEDVCRWIDRIERAEKDTKRHTWETRCRKVLRRYKDEREGNEGRQARRFALLWANQETLKPVVYARCPRPEVNRRFKDEDPVGRVTSEVLERALTYSVDAHDFDAVLKLCRDDFLLYARGQGWIRYVPHMRSQQTPVTPLAPQPAPEGDTGTEGPSISEDADAYQDAAGRIHDAADVQHNADVGHHIVEDVLDYEEVIADHIHYDDFIHPTIRTWPELPWGARRAFMTRDELIDRFGEKLGKQIPLDWKQDREANDHTTMSGEDDAEAKAAIYEVWDKRTKKALWISKGWPQAFLDERDDPLGLVDFFPFPRPMQGTTGTDSVIPVPDYVFYQDQAEEIDELTAKIGRLEKGLKCMGFYAGASGLDLSEMFSEGENRLVPIADWGTLKGDGGVKGLVEWWPLEQVVSALEAMVKVRAQLIQDVYQITGIADILRGASDADETATAQGIKANWGAVRVRDKQKEVARFARDLIRLMGQVIASRFSVSTLKTMTDMQMFDSVEQKQAVQQQIAAQQAQAQALAAARAQQMQAGPQPPAGAPGSPAGPVGPGAPPHPMQAGAPTAPPQPHPMAQPGQPGPQPPAALPPPSAPSVPFKIQRQLSNPTWQEVEQLLQDEAARQFRIDVETDSTIEPDEQAAKQAATEFIEALGHYISSTLPAVQSAPQMAPLLGETMKYLVRHYRAGRELEDIIDKLADSVTNAPPAPPQQNPQAGAQAAQMLASQAKMELAGVAARKEQREAVEGAQRLGLERDKFGLDVWNSQHDAHREFVDIGSRP